LGESAQIHPVQAIRRLVELGAEMSEPPNAQLIADDLAEAGAGYVLIAPADSRDEVLDSLAEGFRDACIEHGIQVNDEDVAYYVKVVMANVRELMPRMVEAELKAKQ
jgi:hypothetical protein